MNKKTIGTGFILLLLIGGTGIWALLGGESDDFTQVKQLQDKLLNDKTLSESERDAGWREVKQKWSTFSTEEQRQLKTEASSAKQQSMHEYFALKTEDERIAHIDKVVDEWAAAKKKGASKTSDKNKAAAKKEKATQKENGKGKQHDAESMREGLRNYLDSKTADERAKERIYWTRVKRRWAERHGMRK